MEISSAKRATVPAGLMTDLREQTQELHTRIESRMDFSVHFASLVSYRQLIARYYGLYKPFEAWLFAPDRAADWAALDIEPRDRQKARWLEDDLQALGLTSEQIADLPLCPHDALPHPHTPGELLGCAYVLEGATLGGQIIGRQLEKSLGLSVGAPGTRFFTGYGAETGAHWKRFRHAAEAFAQRENALHPHGDGPQKAVDFARQTFLAIESAVFKPL